MFRQTQYKLKQKVKMEHFIEWLTRDEEKTETNKKDAFLYISLSVSSFVTILDLFKIINKKSNIQKGNKSLQILLLSGTHDPATNFGNDIVALNELYQDAGFSCAYKLYQEGRHDTLQEINRNEVFQDILDFLNK